MNSYWYSHIVHMYVCRYVTREMCYTWDSPDVEIHPVYRSHPPHLVSAGKFPRTQGHHDGAENVGQRWVGRCWEVGSPVRDDMRPRFAQHLWITQSFMAMKSYEIMGAKLRKIWEHIYWTMWENIGICSCQPRDFWVFWISDQTWLQCHEVLS